MPIENERKFLLDVEPIQYLKYLKEKWKPNSFEITQGYISGNSRLRHLLRHETHEEQYVFTYKKKIAGKIVEIETEISSSDYAMLWTEVSDVIHKTRAKILFEDAPGFHLTWEVDFFRNHHTGNIYLVMAEVELPEDMIEPRTVPEFVKNNLLYLTPLNDPRFKNKNLGEEKKVKKLLDEVKAQINSYKQFV